MTGIDTLGKSESTAGSEDQGDDDGKLELHFELELGRVNGSGKNKCVRLGKAYNLQDLGAERREELLLWMQNSWLQLPTFIYTDFSL